MDILLVLLKILGIIILGSTITITSIVAITLIALFIKGSIEAIFEDDEN